MELDELRTEWARRDEALAKSLRLQTQVMREVLTAPQVARLRRMGGMNTLELVVWIAFLLGFGSFTADSFGDWKFFVPGALLMAWTIAMGAITFQERAKLQAVDLGKPPVAIQKELALLRIERARTVKWAFLTGQVLWWIPFAIVLFRGLFDVDLYALSSFMTWFIAINLAVGVAFIPLALLAGRAVGPHLAGGRFSHAVLDAVTGRDMAEAGAIAARIARFERESDG